MTARHNPEAASGLRAYARAIKSYQNPEKLRYVKLLDGSVTDNFGVTGLSLARAKAQNEYGPLTAKQAVNIRLILFLVANAGTETNYSFA